MQLLYRPRHYFSSSVGEHKRPSEGGTKKRRAYCRCLSLLSSLIENSFYMFFLTFVIASPTFHLWGLCMTGTMIYIDCFSCQMDFRMGLIWLTIREERLFFILCTFKIFLICSLFINCCVDNFGKFLNRGFLVVTSKGMV